MRHEKKIWPESFEPVLNGIKKYEVRLADWECNPGDELWLREWDPKTKEYTGREIIKKITFVGKISPTLNEVMWPKEDIEKYGFQVLSLE